MRLLALALAAVALLPPDGWALCVAPGGHVEVEPATRGPAGACCDDQPGSGGLSADGEDCASCFDLVAFAGDASLSRDPAAPGSAAAVVPTASPAAPAAPPGASRDPRPRCARPPRPPLASILLRN